MAAQTFLSSYSTKAERDRWFEFYGLHSEFQEELHSEIMSLEICEENLPLICSVSFSVPTAVRSKCK